MGIFDGLAGPLAGGLLSGGLSLIGAQQQNSANAGAVQQQEQYQTAMSNSAYQRSAADMKAAGLNPMMMMASGGGPANTPTGGAMQAENTLQGAASSAKDVGANAKFIDVASKTAQQDYENKSMQGQMLGTQSQQIRANTQNAIKQGEILESQKQIEANNAKISDSQVPASQAMNQYMTKKSNIDYKLAPAQAAVGMAGSVLGGASSAGRVMQMTAPKMNTINPNTTGTFDLGTGEIH